MAMAKAMQGVVLFGLMMCLLVVTANAWMPPSKIRGVSLGGLFISEPWFMGDEWTSMGCGGFIDESSCVQSLGQASADKAFQRHWDTWITQDDIHQIKAAGLNTIRIPLGFWLHEPLVLSSEHFPRGAFSYLQSLCSMAADADLYIVLGLHAAPGGQSPNQQFTGKAVDTVGFFTSENYERAYNFLEWLTSVVHTHDQFSRVGAIEILNEPVTANKDQRHSLSYEYYPTAWKRIRTMEDSLNVNPNDRLHIMMMDSRWYGQDDPSEGLSGIDLTLAVYDNHNYRAFDFNENCKTCGVPATRRDYLKHYCSEDLSGGEDSPLIVGEWSLATTDPDGDEFSIEKPDAAAFYRKFFGAQIRSYERERGWIFWTWRVGTMSGRNDFRWGYQRALAAGAIPAGDPTLANQPDVCANLT